MCDILGIGFFTSVQSNLPYNNTYYLACFPISDLGAINEMMWVWYWCYENCGQQ